MLQLLIGGLECLGALGDLRLEFLIKLRIDTLNRKLLENQWQKV
jgi:hypothetical protein